MCKTYLSQKLGNTSGSKLFEPNEQFKENILNVPRMQNPKFQLFYSTYHR